MENALEQIFRWFHVFAGIMWIGLLYWFNFVNSGFAPTMDPATKKAVIPELMPRGLFWFRWSAAWTWITGVLLLLMVFYHGGMLFDGDASWGVSAIVMIAVTFLATFIYDAIFKSPLGKNLGAGAAVGLIITAIILALMTSWGGFGYRGYVIHMGTMFGTIMAFNVWFRIWPAQQKIIPAIKNGEAPDAALLALAASRSKHNTYLSMPLIWSMINSHTTFFAGGNLGIPSSMPWIGTLVFVLLGWGVINLCYKKAAKVKGW